MASQTEIREENKNFYNFCKNVCFDYAERNSRKLLGIASALRREKGFDFDLFFKKVGDYLESSNAVEIVDNEILCYDDYPVKKGALDYKRDASRFIENRFRVNVPACSLIPVRFYQEFMQGLLRKAIVVSLEGKLVESVDLLTKIALERYSGPCFKEQQFVKNLGDELKRGINKLGK